MNHFTAKAVSLSPKTDMRKRKKRKINKTSDYDRSIVQAPFNESLPAQQRTKACIEMSEIVTRLATLVICQTIVNNEELFRDERTSIAHAFLQRVTSTHMCNHKLTTEGIVYNYNGEAFQLHEEYKTMTQTRSVYEHLAMFYFLFKHPKTADEQAIVWKYWQINSKKNVLDYDADGDEFVMHEQEKAKREIEALREEILSSEIGKACADDLDKLTKAESRPSNGSIELYKVGDQYKVRRVTYSQAWKYLFGNEGMTLLYRHLSMHCHPVYHGLLQYQQQSLSDQGEDAIPLFLSSCFLAYMCQLFLNFLPNGLKLLRDNCSDYEYFVFHSLSQMPIQSGNSPTS